MIRERRMREPRSSWPSFIGSRWGLALLLSFEVWGAPSLSAVTITQHPDNSYIVFEAETGTQQNTNATDYWIITNDVTANAGQAIMGFASTAARTDGEVVYSLHLTNTGNYKLYYRFRAIDVDLNGSRINNDSFYSATNFNSPPPNASEGGAFAAFTWVVNSPKTNFIASAPGTRDFTISIRESGATLDTFIFSTDFGLTATQLDAIVMRGNIPEPSSLGLALLGCGIGILCRRRGRRGTH